FGAEILSAVAVIVDFGFDPVDEVFIIIALAKEMPSRARPDEDAGLHLPLSLVFRMGLPTFQVLTVEQLHPTFVVVLVIAGLRRLFFQVGSDVGLDVAANPA